MKYQIVFNKKISKFDGLVNGRVVSRAASRERVVNALVQKHGMPFDQKPMESAVGAAMNPVEPKCEFGVEERFDFIHKFVDMLIRKQVTSFIITGDGGLGKTYNVIQALKKAGKKELGIGDYDGDYVVQKGYSTAKALYRSLYDYNGKIIIFDDCDSVFKDPIGGNILKGALDSEEKRVITWGAEFSDKDDLPNRFEFIGRCIFISNLPQAKFPQSLLSRSLRVDLTLTTDEKVERIEHVMKEEKADPDDKKAVLEFIKKHANKATDLNIRSALSVLKLRKNFGNDFERIALYNFTA